MTQKTQNRKKDNQKPQRRKTSNQRKELIRLTQPRLGYGPTLSLRTRYERLNQRKKQENKKNPRSDILFTLEQRFPKMAHFFPVTQFHSIPHSFWGRAPY